MNRCRPKKRKRWGIQEDLEAETISHVFTAYVLLRTARACRNMPDSLGKRWRG